MIPAPPNSQLMHVVTGSIYTTAAQLPLLHCVYTHTDADGKVIYVGLCKLSDVFHAADARSNSEWIKCVKSDAFAIQIDSVSPQIADCVNRRFQLIQQHKPHCNVHGIDTRGSTKAMPVRCNETGETFPTVTAAAEAHGVSQSQLSNHLAGKRYYKRVNGRTYSKVME